MVFRCGTAAPRHAVDTTFPISESAAYQVETSDCCGKPLPTACPRCIPTSRQRPPKKRHGKKDPGRRGWTGRGKRGGPASGQRSGWTSRTRSHHAAASRRLTEGVHRQALDHAQETNAFLPAIQILPCLKPKPSSSSAASASHLWITCCRRVRPSPCMRQSRPSRPLHSEGTLHRCFPSPVRTVRAESYRVRRIRGNLFERSEPHPASSRLAMPVRRIRCPSAFEAGDWRSSYSWQRGSLTRTGERILLNQRRSAVATDRCVSSRLHTA